jgi:uncharacterized protein YheU (UPF0270 family)
MDTEQQEKEEGVEIPMERINPDTLRKMVEEFVTREWSDLTDANFSLDSKVEQVLEQLREGTAKIVYDLVSKSCNILPR